MTEDANEPQQLHVVLKIGETEREVSLSVGDTVGSLKLREFPDQRSRLVFRGRELRDTEVLSDLPVHGCIVHCILVPRAPAGSAEARQRDGSDSAELTGSILYIALGFLLMLAWMVRVAHPELFQPSAVAMLGGLSAVFVAYLVQRILAPQSDSST
jgi:hypothetical protein